MNTNSVLCALIFIALVPQVSSYSIPQGWRFTRSAHTNAEGEDLNGCVCRSCVKQSLLDSEAECM